MIAGTDCGFSTFAGLGAVDPEIVWAKLATGAMLLAWGAWRLRRPPAPAKTPRWLSFVDGLNLPLTFAIGAS